MPQFAELYSAKDKQLPLITTWLFDLSALFTHFLPQMMFIAVSTALFGYFIGRKTNFGVKWKARLCNRLPLFGTILQYARIVFFCQSCALMLNAHIPLDRMLSTFLQQHSDPILSQEVRLILRLLQQGYAFNEGVNPNVFSPEMVQMLSIGEQSGHLPEMLNYVGQLYQQRLDDKVERLSQLLEPALMLLMGVMVAFILIGLYLPMFDMGAVIG